MSSRTTGNTNAAAGEKPKGPKLVWSIQAWRYKVREFRTRVFGHKKRKVEPVEGDNGEGNSTQGDNGGGNSTQIQKIIEGSPADSVQEAGMMDAELTLIQSALDDGDDEKMQKHLNAFRLRLRGTLAESPLYSPLDDGNDNGDGEKLAMEGVDDFRRVMKTTTSKEVKRGGLLVLMDLLQVSLSSEILPPTEQKARAIKEYADALAVIKQNGEVIELGAIQAGVVEEAVRLVKNAKSSSKIKVSLFLGNFLDQITPNVDYDDLIRIGHPRKEVDRCNMRDHRYPVIKSKPATKCGARGDIIGGEPSTRTLADICSRKFGLCVNGSDCSRLVIFGAAFFCADCWERVEECYTFEYFLHMGAPAQEPGILLKRVERGDTILSRVNYSMDETDYGGTVTDCQMEEQHAFVGAAAKEGRYGGGVVHENAREALERAARLHIKKNCSDQFVPLLDSDHICDRVVGNIGCREGVETKAIGDCHELLMEVSRRTQKKVMLLLCKSASSAAKSEIITLNQIADFGCVTVNKLARERHPLLPALGVKRRKAN